MKTKRILIAAAAMTAMAMLASCAFLGARGDTGTVVVSVGGGVPGARSPLEGSPDFMPIFTSLTVTISGPDMARVSGTVSLGTITEFTYEQALAFVNLLTASLEVPAGSDRTVEIYAVPDWYLTETYYSLMNPTNAFSYLQFVKAYGGSTTVNVPASGTTNVAIRLEAVETKIILPDAYNYGSVQVADSLSDSSEPQVMSHSLYSGYDLGFDRYGYLYFSDADGILQFYGPSATAVTNGTHGHVGLPTNPMAYDKRNDQFYFYNGAYLRNSIDDSDITLASGWSPGDYGLAVDADGYVYASVMQGEGENPSIAKFSVSDSAAALVTIASYESLGLAGGTNTSYLTVTDMRVQDGKLYIAAGEHESYSNLHHGKIVEARLSDLSKLREFGWADATSETPIPDPQNQLYGPTRFIALAPRKLIFSDEGYDASGYTDINRVVELDTESWTMETGLSGAVSFFEGYYC